LANADQLLFWGKITTTSTPYYIAVAIDFKGHYGFPHKKFFYRFALFNAAKITFSFRICQPLMNSIKTTQTSLILCLLLGILKQFYLIVSLREKTKSLLKIRK